MIQTTRYAYDGQELKPGIAVRHQTNNGSLTFDFFVVLDSDSPDAWHGEVRLRGRTLIRTNSFANEAMAGKAAEDAILERLVGILADQIED
ncbi:hypothetical protein [Aeromicrobium sp.]|uniref:hypothetical protein n=1 Tax=Aeromicrobium sp. TaxID=1871063 RepID=UPI002FC84B6E